MFKKFSGIWNHTFIKTPYEAMNESLNIIDIRFITVVLNNYLSFLPTKVIHLNYFNDKHVSHITIKIYVYKYNYIGDLATF